MKNFILKILLIPIIGILFSGCYTTLWMPDGEYDTEDIQSNQDANYYPINDYGDYYYYYNTPWWSSAVQSAQDSKDRSKDVNALRKTDSGRGEFTRGSERTSRELPTAPLPTVSAPAPTTSTSTSSNTSKDNSGNRVESTSSSSNSSGNDKKTNNNNPVRNNDGNRNTNGR
jgi:hypothetical protein